MFALTSRRIGGSGAALRERYLPASGGFVLPRWLRRPARLLSRFVSGEIEAPPYSAAVLSAAVISAFSVYGTVLGGHVPTVVQAVTARTGFAIEEIRVSGNRETSEIDIFDRVGLNGWTSLVGFNPDEARQRIESLPWVASASVRKIYPATLEVKIVERTPFAIWQHGSRLTLVQKDGRVIAPLTGSRYLTLPLIVGPGATEAAADFIARLGEFPELAPRVMGYVRVSDRRWDIRLQNGITVKLPERGEEAALEVLVELDKRHDLLSRDIVSVDMRFEDRLVVGLAPGAAEARETALKEKLGKDYHPAERSI